MYFASTRVADVDCEIKNLKFAVVGATSARRFEDTSVIAVVMELPYSGDDATTFE